MSEDILVSIIIRTCGRIGMLSNAIDSVRIQTYTNIELIIVEDGKNNTQKFLQSYLTNYNYKYYFTGQKAGRTKAGNLGLTKAKGKYINFLDEDDILLDDHVETLVKCLENCEQAVAYTLAEEYQIRIISMEPYEYHVKRKLVRYNYPFNRLLLCYMNYFPIQSVMFHRRLYDAYGGFDESFDMLEDWDLWLKYAMHTSFYYMNKVTSIYFTPYKSKNKTERELTMKQAEEKIKNKLKECDLSINLLNINAEVDYIISVFNKHGFYFYIKKLRNLILYHDR